jgi:hypothetical protein
MRAERHCSSAGFAGATWFWGEVRKGGAAPLRGPWTANLLEQYDDNRLIRPRADYKGAGRRSFVAVDKR